ncbi:MAG: acetyl-CoA synthetase, partial [Mycobacteriales bacterium]
MNRDLCIVGVAQQTVRPPGPAPEPLVSWEQVARGAADDAGAPDLLSALDSIQVVYCQTWPYDDPAGRLAERLRASPGHKLYSGIGGT